MQCGRSSSTGKDGGPGVKGTGRWVTLPVMECNHFHSPRVCISLEWILFLTVTESTQTPFLCCCSQAAHGASRCLQVQGRCIAVGREPCMFKCIPRHSPCIWEARQTTSPTSAIALHTKILEGWNGKCFEGTERLCELKWDVLSCAPTQGRPPHLDLQICTKRARTEVSPVSLRWRLLMLEGRSPQYVCIGVFQGWKGSLPSVSALESSVAGRQVSPVCLHWRLLMLKGKSPQCPCIGIFSCWKASLSSMSSLESSVAGTLFSDSTVKFSFWRKLWISFIQTHRWDNSRLW